MSATQHIQSAFFETDNKEGVDLNNTLTSVANITSLNQALENISPRFALGERVQGINGSEWMYVQASTTVTQYNVVAIDCNFAANSLTTTLASSNVYSYGVAEFQTSVANGPGLTGDFFWACMLSRGGGLVAVAASSSALRGTQLYLLTATPGALTSSVSTVIVRNIWLNTSAVSTTGFTDYVQTSYITVST